MRYNERHEKTPSALIFLPNDPAKPPDPLTSSPFAQGSFLIQSAATYWAAKMVSMAQSSSYMSCQHGLGSAALPTCKLVPRRWWDVLLIHAFAVTAKDTKRTRIVCRWVSSGVIGMVGMKYCKEDAVSSVRRMEFFLVV